MCRSRALTILRTVFNSLDTLLTLQRRFVPVEPIAIDTPDRTARIDVSWTMSAIVPLPVFMPPAHRISWLLECCAPLEDVGSVALVECVYLNGCREYDRLHALQHTTNGYVVRGDPEFWCVNALVDLLNERLSQFQQESQTLVHVSPLPIELNRLILEALTPVPAIHQILYRLSHHPTRPRPSSTSSTPAVHDLAGVSSTDAIQRPTPRSREDRIRFSIWNSFRDGHLPGGLGSERDSLCSAVLTPKLDRLFDRLEYPMAPAPAG